MPQPPQILNSRIVARSKIFEIEEMHLRFSNGQEVQYERARGNSRGAVLVVPLLDQDTILLIREYAAGTERYELAFPKGRIEHDEDTLAAANREIQEEVGYAANELTLLRTLSMAPGYFSHATHVVLAQDLVVSPAAGDEPEPIEVVPWKLADLDDLFLQDDFTEARSMAALFLTLEYLKK